MTGLALPRVLVGPIPRRCSAHEITVWLATSEPVPGVSLSLSDAAGGGVGHTPAHVSVAVGDRLHVHLLRARPTGGRFPTGKTLFYEVSVLDDEDRAAITYPGVDRASLVLQEEGPAPFNILYGSCRKYHGPGFDASRAADAFMARHINRLEHRPQILALGGDQIYADDVPAVLIRPLQAMAREILGFDESLPGIAKPHVLPVNGRQKVIEEAGLSSDHGANHLLTFGEFCAAYLLAWNPRLWPPLTTAQELWEAIGPDVGSDPGWLEKQFKEEYEKIHDFQRLQVEEYREGSRAMRRLLANVPTYMMFDDHEVTDDWRFDGKWDHQVVRSSDLGRRIVANGVAAFWLFQGMGNDPGEFWDDPRVQRLAPMLERHLQDLRNRPKGSPSTNTQRLERLLAWNRKWSFATPTTPRVVFLNTRTARTQSGGRSHGAWSLKGMSPATWGKEERTPILYRAPRLMDTSEVNRVRRLIREAILSDRVRRVVMVAPTPVYGLTAVETAAEMAVRLGYMTALEADAESFHVDPSSFLDVVDALFFPSTPSGGDRQVDAPGSVVILSGDVHYGFAVAGWLMEWSTKISFPVAQFTSSAAKNHPTERDTFLLQRISRLMSLRWERTFFRFWWRPGSNSAAHSSIDPGPVKPYHGTRISPDQKEIDELRTLFEDKSNGADLRFAEAFQFAMAGKEPALETDNNMGYLRLNGGRVEHRLLVWRGSLGESLRTAWEPGSWPVIIS